MTQMLLGDVVGFTVIVLLDTGSQVEQAELKFAM